MFPWLQEMSLHHHQNGQNPTNSGYQMNPWMPYQPWYYSPQPYPMYMLPPRRFW
ncbi:hypothetical protein JCM9140_4358 [Halalkalibacter wakoensis JCM 9140]|uniref:Uncharacterized protein n=1 Tax=Halalkalibacter wakoensis JCM 9140 TaxID=1236970 RepID=W4Q8Z1_9BACI|nr:hypothetical protein [Halalkalibacter wakoensis]GAE28153.1 hypothetical protein JCM9140_4358 [Halalkalibacter wakoensis JCM 9140]